MAVTIIPMADAGQLGNFFYRVDLDGVTYEHTLQYNSRDDAWYMMVSDVSGNVIRAGIKLVINWPLLRQVKIAGRPAGELMVLDQRETILDKPMDPDLDALGVDVLMAYIEESSLP